jgi:hypothetical protein
MPEFDYPLIAFAPDGDAFTLSDIIPDAESSQADSSPVTNDGVVADLAYLRTPLEGITLADAGDALKHLDPDMPMQQWIEVAAGLKHQFDSNEALALWDAWSAKGKKYVDAEETRYRWNSLKAQPIDRAPVTIRSLFRQAQARGWVNQTLAHRQHETVNAWIKSNARSTEELFDQGAKRIAKIAPLLGQLERKALIGALKEALSSRGMAVSMIDIKKAVSEVEKETARATGVPPWAKGVCFVTALNEFYRPSTDRHFAPEVIDLMYSVPPVGEDKAIRPRDYLIQVAGIAQVENLRYQPSLGSKRFFTLDNVPYVNTYRPDYAPAEPDRADEAGEIWWDHICKLVREPAYRQTLMDVLAYPVQFPGRKMRWAPVIQSAEGAGKTVLAVALKAVLGRRNVTKVNADAVLNKSWNDWAYGRQVVVMEEIRVIGTNRHAVMDKLKPLITDDDVGLQRRFQDHSTVESCTNYLMFTNYQDALAVNEDGRRYFVLMSPIQNREDIVAMGGEQHFNRLYSMIRDNPGGLRAWFEQWPIAKDFSPEGRAPVTPYLHELADNSATPLAAAIKNAIEDRPHPLVGPDLLSLGCLRGCLDNARLADYSDQALACVLRELGWRKFERVILDGGKHQLWLKGMVRDPRGLAISRLKLDEIL